VIYFIRLRCLVVAKFLYESDRDACLLALIRLEPGSDYQAGIVEEVKVC